MSHPPVTTGATRVEWPGRFSQFTKEAARAYLKGQHPWQSYRDTLLAATAAR
jgi:hypothetical protein